GKMLPMLRASAIVFGKCASEGANASSALPEIVPDRCRHDREMEPQAGRTISPFRPTKRSNDSLRKTTRRSRVHVQTIGLNAETKKCRHRADGEICLLTFPFIGLLRVARLPGPS